MASDIWNQGRIQYEVKEAIPSFKEMKHLV